MKLRTLLIALALLLTYSLSWAGGPEILLMATRPIVRTATFDGAVDTSTFEGPSADGWTTTDMATSSLVAHGGTVSFKNKNVSSTESTTKSFAACRASYLDFWYYTGGSYAGSVTVNGVVTALTATGGTWVHSTNILVPDGACDVTVTTTSATANTIYLDDFTVPLQ